MIAFLDANVLIYLVEGAEPFAGAVRTQLHALKEAHQSLRIAMSELSRLECRTGPMKSADTQLLAEYDTFFEHPDLMLVGLSTTVVDLATALRARYGLRTPDALQAACCLQLGEEHVFLTGDKVFRRIAGLHTQLVA